MITDSLFQDSIHATAVQHKRLLQVPVILVPHLHIRRNIFDPREVWREAVTRMLGLQSPIIQIDSRHRFAVQLDKRVEYAVIERICKRRIRARDSHDILSYLDWRRHMIRAEVQHVPV